jgi:hypothetical protein
VWLPQPPPPLNVHGRTQLLLLILVSIALFGSLRTPDFNDYDGLNFAFAVRDGYDLALHQPHPPGFPLYILAAKGLFLLTHDALSALTLLSAVGGALALAMIWWLARMWWPEKPAVAWLAAGWLLVTPHFWLSAEKELSDAPTLALHIAAVACGWRGLWSWRWRIAATVVVAVGLGFRIQNIAGFVPPWAFLMALSAWSRKSKVESRSNDSRLSTIDDRRPTTRALHRLSVHTGLLLFVCALWFIGMVIATGGWSAYRHAMADYTSFLAQSPNTLGIVEGLNPRWWALRLALHANTFLLAAFGIVLRDFIQSNAVILWVPGGIAVLAIALVLWKARSPRAITATLWALPYLVSEVLLFQPSNERYALPLLPPLILFASAGLVSLRIPRAAKLAVAAPLAIWLVFITTWCVKTLRVERSPLVMSVHWIFDADHGAVWGSGLIQVEGEAARAAQYYHPMPGFIAGRLDRAFVAPPGTPLPDGHVVDSARFTRSLVVHTKHSDLIATLLGT